jgi:hypothetical protein
MSISTIGIMRRDVTILDVFRFVKSEFKVKATLEPGISGNCGYIHFNYKDDDTERMLQVFYGNDYGDVTAGYSKDHEVTEISVNTWGHAEEIISSIVKYFGGWYMPDDCKREATFYDFKDTSLSTPLERFVFEKLADDHDWKMKIKLAKFISDNFDEISKVVSEK